uniref:Phospholipid phosphatase 4 n=1 Tax=Crocodylus porosus TaxID=8502 RepID=A0A7M4EUR0_CROPO
MRDLAIEVGIRALLFGVFVFTEFLDPFHRVIQPEEIWLYKNPLVQSDNIPTRLMFVQMQIHPTLLEAISFLTPLAVIFVVKIIRRTDKTEIKEAFLAVSLALALNGVCTNTIKLIVGRILCCRCSCLCVGRSRQTRTGQKKTASRFLLPLLSRWSNEH